MSTMTITEGLAELKTLKKRLETKRTFVIQNAVRDDRLKDPLEAQGGTKTVVTQELQAIRDLEARFVNIRDAIAAANANTKVKVGNTERTIAEWLVWRREVAPDIQKFFVTLKAQLERAKAVTENPRYPSNRETGESPKMAYGLDDKTLLGFIEQHDVVMGSLDGQLSLKNATTSIEVA